MSSPTSLSTAAADFRLHLYAVIARVLAHLDRMAVATGDASAHWLQAFPFLAAYRSLLAQHEPADLAPDLAWAWWDLQVTAGRDQAQADGHLPLRALRSELGLGEDDVRFLIGAGLVEEDIRFGALFAALQDPLSARRPCVGLLGWLLAAPDGLSSGEPLDAWAVTHRLLDHGLLTVDADRRGDPRSEWVVRVPPALWDALQGRAVEQPAPGVVRQPRQGFPPLEALILPPALHAQVGRLPELLRGGHIKALVVRGMNGSGRRTLVGSVARSLGHDVLLWRGDRSERSEEEGWRLLGPLATLTGSVPVLRCDPAPGESLDLPPLTGYRGPVGIALGRSGGLRGPLVEHSLSLTLPPPDRAARRRFWQATGVPLAEGTLEEVAGRFLLTGGHIGRVADLAHAYALLAGRAAVQVGDVQQATRALNRQVLETLATHLEPATGWADLVVPEPIVRELQALEARCRDREALRERAGPAFSRSLNRGVRAMLSGPSGTGKTLAARALAASLEMDLYRVDLAAVVNKYIGETERNLNLVLSRAEELDVVLLLDEGDALMTRRTEVRNANDRYANLETNYLLQRLETYEGIVIITTNASQRIDDAFLRRLDVVIDFPAPDAAERWQIWQMHLPRAHAVSAGFLDEVASRCALTGGQIRNAALHATLLARDGEPVGDRHLEQAVQREYRKAGAAYPMRVGPTNGSQLSRVRQFAQSLG